jgi:signal peptidase I
VENLPNEITPEPTPAEQPKTRSLRMVWDVVETLLIALVLFVGINLLTARIRVDGSSMEPNFFNNEYIIVNRLAYKWAKPHRGEVIVFRYPSNPKQDLIKRVIGLPGDVVYITTKQVFINGKLLDETYIADAPNYFGTWRVPENSLFVLGDNRNASYDSKDWGYVPMQNVVGKALMVYWPPTSWGLVRHIPPQTSP